MWKTETLSPEQWAAVARERERWLAIGTCTEPADRETTEEVIADFYQRIGKKRPVFVWNDGPLSSSLAVTILSEALNGGQLRNQIGGQLLDQLWDQLRNQIGGQLRVQISVQYGGQLWDQLWDQLGEQLWKQLRNQLRNQLWTQLRNQLLDHLWRQLWDQLRGQLGNQLGNQLRNQLSDQLWNQLRAQLSEQLGDQLKLQLWNQLRAQLWNQIRVQLRKEQPKEEMLSHLDNGWFLAEPAYWIGHYAACRDIEAAKYSPQQDELLRQWEKLAAASGWWFPYEGICFCSERHERIHFDAEKRLHCEDGPAILCRDGFSVHAWHGTRVPAEWIEETDDVDPKLALTWENIEQRRCLAEIIGWSKVLNQLSPTVVDEDTPEVGRLLRVDLPDAPGEQFLQVQCGTGRTFVLPVPPEMTSARQANAWTYGLKPEAWGPEVRT